MAKRTKTATKQLQEHVNTCAKEYEHWNALRTDGGTDPNWSDGINLNLVRTHIVCAKKEIRRTCDKFKLVVPCDLFQSVAAGDVCRLFCHGREELQPATH